MLRSATLFRCFACLIFAGVAFGPLAWPMMSAASTLSSGNDIFVSATSSGTGFSTIEEYTPAGEHVRSIDVPADSATPANLAFANSLHGIAVRASGQIVGLNGTTDPQVATFSPSTRAFTSQTMPSNGLSGPIATYQDYTFFFAASSPSYSGAVLRLSPDGTTQQFGVGTDYRTFVNLTMGLDGKLSVLYESRYGTYCVDVYDPSTLQLLRTTALQVPPSPFAGDTNSLGSFAVAADGGIYATEFRQDIFHFSASGALLQTASDGAVAISGSNQEIEIDPGTGRIYISVRGTQTDIVQTDAALSSFQTIIQVNVYQDQVGYFTIGNAALAAGLNTDTHVLWTNTDGQMSLWNYVSANGTFTQNSYGPYSGWTAKALADGGTDGQTRVLWIHSSGAASLWSLDNGSGLFTQSTFGPYPGWTAVAVSVDYQNIAHILWTNADGRASLWDYNTVSDTFAQNTYGPYPGWTARSLGSGDDNLTRIAWNRPDGTSSFWGLDNVAADFAQFTFGPYPGWTANTLSGSVLNNTPVLWTNTDGRASLWNYNILTGAFSQNTYGPYPNWTAATIAGSPNDTLTRILWNNVSGAASLWNLDNRNAVFTQYTFGPYPGWKAAAISDCTQN